MAFGLLVLGLRFGLGGGDAIQDRIQTYAVVPEATLRLERGRRRAGLVRLRLRMNAMLSALASENLNLQLARANWPLTVPEFLILRFGSALACLALGWLFSASPLPGIGLAGIAYVTPGIYLQRSISRRQTQFTKQLSDVLVLMNGSLRAGHSLLQAMEVVTREMKPPASDEFARVVREVGLGVRLPQALRNLAARIQNGDLDLVVTAIDIQYQVGGNMAVILGAITETIRERVRLLGEVRVLTTQQRYSGYMLSVLPFVVGALMFVINPNYMRRLFEPGITLCIPIGAVIGIVIGHFTIQRISKIEV
jgi:tight adherence protein B